MQRLIAAGILYLLGMATILVLKPSLMFTEDGSWKEFGIGRNKNTHTWMPIWFFAILWALTCYILVGIVFTIYVPQKQVRLVRQSVEMSSELEPELDLEMEPELAPAPVPVRLRRARGKPMNLPDGYYLMNADATNAAGGIPKYVYLGKGLPHDS